MSDKCECYIVSVMVNTSQSPKQVSHSPCILELISRGACSCSFLSSLKTSIILAWAPRGVVAICPETVNVYSTQWVTQCFN